LHPDEADGLKAIEERIASLIAYRSGLVKEARDIRRKKSDTVREIRELTANIRREGEAVEECYETVKFCCEKRKEILAKIGELKSRVREVEADLKRFEQQASLEEGDLISERIRAIDWRLQTERHTREEEKRLISLVRELEAKLYMWKKAYEKRRGLSSLLREVRGLKEELEELAQIREEATIELKARKNRLTTGLKAREQLFCEINELEQDIAELEQRRVSVNRQIDELKEKKRELVKAVRMREVEAAKAKEREVLERAVVEAKEKLAKGRKITFNELRLILSDDQTGSPDGSSTISNM